MIRITWKADKVREQLKKKGLKLIFNKSDYIYHVWNEKPEIEYSSLSLKEITEHYQLKDCTISTIVE